jgi:enamine deaminase RidA (YjgF/YER057c/UK114 family)
MKALLILAAALFAPTAALAATPPTAEPRPAIVVAHAKLPLAHTAQFTADTAEGALLHVERVVGPEALLLKLNVVAVSPEAAEIARTTIRERYRARNVPPVTVVIGALPNEAAIGIDAIAASKREFSRSEAATLPPGAARVYISGQAEKGATPAEAAAATIASLKETLAFAGSSPEQVVQAKCFLTPMSASASVVKEFEKAFGKHNVPPLVFVEWKSELPIEIELIAAAPPAPADAPVVEYLTPPGKTASPLFARVVKVNCGDTVYIGEIAGADPGSGAEQVTSIFGQLREAVHQARSDMRHLVKATYYVSDHDASKQLNVIRPKLYDPERPPAASKAMVPAVGVPNRSITIDMIATRVPEPRR